MRVKKKRGDILLYDDGMKLLYAIVFIAVFVALNYDYIKQEFFKDKD